MVDQIPSPLSPPIYTSNHNYRHEINLHVPLSNLDSLPFIPPSHPKLTPEVQRCSLVDQLTPSHYASHDLIFLNPFPYQSPIRIPYPPPPFSFISSTPFQSPSQPTSPFSKHLSYPKECSPSPLPILKSHNIPERRENKEHRGRDG